MDNTMITTTGIMALQTGKQYREKAKRRQKAWRDKMDKSGYMQISAFLPGELVVRVKEDGAKHGRSMTKELERILYEYYSGKPEDETDIYDNILSGLKGRINQGESYNDILPDLCLLIDDMRKDNLSWQEIADRLNEAGIPKRTKGQWTFKAVTSTYYRCQKDKLTGKD